MNQNNCHESVLSTEAHPSIEQNTSSPEITPYAMTFIQCKARQLVGKCGIRECDREDIEQELYLDLWERLDKFDAEKATYNTFVQRIVEHKISNILRDRNTKKGQAERMCVSLSMPVGDAYSDDGPLTLGDCISQEEFEQNTRGKTRSRLEELELIEDVHQVVSMLPEHLRTPCELLFSGKTISETARILDIKRSTFYGWILKPLRQAFRDTDVESYFYQY